MGFRSLPPTLSRLVLRTLAAMRGQPALVSEMDDLFRRRVSRDGLRRARSWYRRQALGFVLRAPSLGGRTPRGGTLDDLRLAWRSLVRTPGPSVTMVLTLGCGVGAATAVFSVVNAALLRPLPFRDAHQLVRIWESSPERGLDRFSVSVPNYRDWMAEAETIDQAAAYLRGETRALATTGTPSAVRVAAVEPRLFSVLGVKPVLGRTLAIDDAHQPVIVLGHDLWMRAFGGDASVVRRRVSLDGAPFEIVGVMPPRFGIPNEAAEAWTPWTMEPAGHSGSHYLRVVARMSEGQSVANVQLDLERIARRLAEVRPDTNSGWSVLVDPLLDTVVDPSETKALWILLAVTGLFLLVGCGNVATLGLARASAREHEMAVRAALGASRARVLRQLFLESAFVTVGVGLVGSLSAGLAMSAVRSLGPVEIPRIEDVVVDGRVLLFAFAAAALASVLSALLPGLRGLGSALAALGRARKGGGSLGARRSRERNALVAGQVAVSVVLLAGAGLLVRSFARLQERDLGFRAEGIMTANVSLPRWRYPSSRETLPAFEELLRRVASIPGVEAVTGASQLPFVDSNSGDLFVPLGGEAIAREDAPDADVRAVAARYFQVMGIPLVAGSTSEFEAAGAGLVAVISETAAQRHWPGQDPLGARFRLGNVDGPTFTIVGIAADVTYYGIAELERRPMIYFPLTQYDGAALTLAVRAAAEARQAVASAVRAEISGLDSELAAPEVGTMDEALAQSLAARRFQTYALGIVAGLSLIMAAAGLFGLTSFLARQQRREIGIRMALGATSSSVAGRLTLHGVGLAVIGTATGTVLGWFLANVLRPLLFELEPGDPVSFGTSAVVMLVAATAANAWPALRASRTDPVVTLSSE